MTDQTKQTPISQQPAGQPLQPTHPRALEPAEPVAPSALTFTADEIAADGILAYFAFGHLPPHLQAVSAIYARAAKDTIAVCARTPERTVALRKLLEAKDAAVRSALPAQI